MKILPINLDDLIHARSVESVRREFKKSWSEPALEQVIRTICAFANDFLNLNGGYVVMGVEELNGLPVLPPHGLEGENLDEIQKEIQGQCKRLNPDYQPLISPEVFQGKPIVVIWAPAGETRPYQAPKSRRGSERAYYVRLGSETVEAKDDILTQLVQMTAKVPFDDRRHTSVTMDALSPALVRNYLFDVKSDLVAAESNISDAELYRKLRICSRINEHEVPRNVALLFFTHDPTVYFPGARIEVVQFGDDAGGDLIEEKIFRGPLHEQIRQVKDYLNGLSTTMIRKIPGQAEAERTVAFPYEAMEEAVVNAAYHRSYEDTYEPIKIYLFPNRLEITSYPGPVAGLEMRHFQTGVSLPAAPNRKRRIGEFLKELKLAEGRGTGIPKIIRKMKENGSLSPVFEFDTARTYFRVILPAHPQYIVINALREAAHFRALGEDRKAVHILEAALQQLPQSGVLLTQLLEYHISLGNHSAVEKLLQQNEKNPDLMEYLEVHAMVQTPATRQESKRVEQLRSDHRFRVFLNAAFSNNPEKLYEFAQTKILLSAALPPGEHVTKKRLTAEAVELYRRIIQLSNDEEQKAWCFFNVARAQAWLRAPETEIESAYAKAVALLPQELRFKEWHAKWKTGQEKNRR